ncbi:DUF4432 family protein [Variovorax ginsengisoli]|uniref:DUF4432 domain-containing protein n=1 Tax=Variovorax ginsengisoli TaxID=363844 RepID=A0ABT9S4M1_9BURK|nr:DUF4432 family protein [Variovorax ginsengisoli]MDP9899291.1 hypothetical protein [Variovorax ginsengisoli]
MTTRVPLHAALFGERERLVVKAPGFVCTAFCFDSGVPALRIGNTRGEVVMLPFRGQQIWSAKFDGRDLTMRSMFDQPARSADYLRTYGAFFLHCGLSGVAAPGPGDTHPLHGELPNARFDEAWIDVDEAGGRLSVGGSYRHTLAFSTDYRATANMRMAPDSALLDVSLEVRNLKRTPMELFYMGHANFRPVDGGRLIYSAPYTPEAVRVRRSIPAHIVPQPGYAELLDALATDPLSHHLLRADVAYDPEVVFALAMAADAQGWAHALQVHPNGGADYAAHRPEQAPCAVRWLCRTADQDALGLCMAATCGVEGRSAERAAGRGVVLDSQEDWRIDLRLGLLTAQETERQEQHIEQAMGRA